MPRKYRDLYKAKVRGAIPATDNEAALFDLAIKEKNNEELAIAIAEKLAEQQHRTVGRPRNTGSDAELVEQLISKHKGNSRLARKEFGKLVCERDKIQKKRAAERFRTAVRNGLKT